MTSMLETIFTYVLSNYENKVKGQTSAPRNHSKKMNPSYDGRLPNFNQFAQII